MTRTKKLETLSPLYCRANGFLLGCFQGLIRYKFARAEFPILRRRMVEFLEEAGIVLEIPRTHRAFDRAGDSLAVRLLKAAAARSPELGDFALIGLSSCIDAAMRLFGNVPSDELRDVAAERMNRRGFDGARLYERFLVDVSLAREDSPDSEVHIQAILTPALALLDELIRPLPTEERTCFVAMPFGPPYSAYFATLYRPLARELNCAAFRMWGGLSGEAYVDLMLTVIRRCARVVADVSGLNPNVVYEVGVARGLDKKVLLLCDRRDVFRVPANIGSDQLLLTYSRRERGGSRGTVLRFAAQASIMDYARELADQRIAAAKRVPGQALPEIPTDPPEVTRMLRKGDGEDAKAGAHRSRSKARGA